AAVQPTGMELPMPFRTFPKRRCAWMKVRSIQRSIEWRKPDGLRRNGRSRRTNGGHAFIASAVPEQSSSLSKRKAGTAFQQAWPACSTTRSARWTNAWRTIVSWISRLKNSLNPRRLDEDLANEFHDHIERRAEDLRRHGLSGAEAQRQAALSFGNLAGLRESSRELRLWAGLEATLQDARYAWRGLRRNPIFAATAIASLGLAIGANTAIYSIVDAALLRPLPIPQPERLFTLATSADQQAGSPVSADRDTFSYPLYEQLRGTAADTARLALFDSPNRVEAK